jgi:hypothetical protein
MTISGVLDQTYARLEHQLVQIAERVPGRAIHFDRRLEFVPSVNSYANIGAVQWVVGAGIQGGDPPVDVGDGDSRPISMLSKADILAYVQDSFTFIRRAISTITNHNAFDMIPHPYDPKSTKVERLTLGVGYACHGWEHYGQLVVYGRLISQSGSPG